MHLLQHYLKRCLSTIPLIILFACTTMAQDKKVPDSVIKACYNKDTKIFFNCLDKQLRTYPSLYTQVAVLNNKAKHLLRTGKYKECYEIAEEGLKAANKQGNHINRGIFYNVQGASKQMQGDLRAAVNKYIQAAVVLEKVGDTLRASLIKANIGNLYYDLKDYENAKIYIADAIIGVTRYNDSVNLSNILAIQASLQLKTGDTTQALKDSRKALALSCSVNNTIGTLSSMLTLANILHSKQQTDSSIFYYKQVDILAKNAGLNYYTILAKAGMVHAYNTKMQYHKASAIGKEALLLPLGNEYSSNLERLYRHYAGALFHTGSHESAYKYLNLSFKISDSIRSTENKLIVNNITTKYETLKKDKQIAQNKLLLQKQAQLIYKRNVYMTGLAVALIILVLVLLIIRMKNRFKVKELNEQKRIQVLQAHVSGEGKERARIAKELHDGVANELAVIKMYLENLPHDIVEAKTKENLKNIAGIAANAHGELRRVSHNLYPVKLLNNGWAEVVKEYLQGINATYDKLEIVITDLAKTVLTKEKQLLAYRLVQEMAGNAIKHSKANKVNIAILISQEKINISVEDDGIGMSENIVKDNSNFVTIREHTSILNGELEIDSSIGRGTSILVSIPNRK